MTTICSSQSLAAQLAAAALFVTTSAVAVGSGVPVRSSFNVSPRPLVPIRGNQRAQITVEDILSGGIAAAPPPLEQIVAEIRSYTALPADWDGEGATPATQAHADAAERLLRKLPAGFALPTPMISSDGVIGLYWDDEKVYADIEVEGEDSFSLFIRDKVGARREQYLPRVSINGLQEDWFFSELAAIGPAYTLAA